jgi:LysM repeat protein
MFKQMRKSLFSLWVLMWLAAGYGQSSVDSLDKMPSRPLHIKQWDENLFYCNWSNQQTFCYFVNSPDTSGGVALELLKGDEKFYLPRHGTLWSVFKEKHKGLDIDLKTGDTVLNMFDGIVRYAQYNNGGFGNLVIVRHYNGLETYYGHLSKIKVKVDQKVKAGDLLGLGGSTGRSYNPHLHLEVRYQDHPLDPFTFIDWEKKVMKTNLLILTKRAFSPWDLGIPPAEISKPNYTTISYNTTQTDTDQTDTNQVTQTQQQVGDVKMAYHVIKKGDTLYSIAKSNGTTLAQICDWNGIKDPNKIYLGQKIRVK